MSKKVNKLIYILFIFSFVFLFKISGLKAACSVSVSAPKSAVAGSTFKVTTSVSSDVGSWYYVLSYDASKVKLVSGNPKVVGVIGDGKTNTYTFKASASGVASFRVTNVSLASNSTNAQCSASAGQANVSIKTQAEIEASYSKNNNLSALTVDGAELSPSFDSNITEYEAKLPVDTTKAKITATTQDNSAQVSGAGEIDVVDGLNKIEITVTAQHGEKKVYTINLTVEELEPVKVKVNGKEYTVVRKENQVENIPVTFVLNKIKISGQEVVAYKSKTANLTLVALKDNEGTVKLFIYNASKKEFKAFNEARASTNLIILDDTDEKAPKDFVKKEIKINDVTINAYKYKYDKEDNYYLVYAKNLETGNEAFYLYDKEDGTYQRYYDNLLDTKDMYIKYLFYVSVGAVGLFVLIIILKIFIGMFTSRESKINRYQRKINKLKKKEYEVYDDAPSIEEIEEDDYKVPKKSRKEKLDELEKAKKRLEKDKTSFRRVSLEDDDM